MDATETSSPAPEPAASSQPSDVQWYHPDPDAPYTELRVGGAPGATRALLMGGAISLAVIAVTVLVLWFGVGETPH